MNSTKHPQGLWTLSIVSIFYCFAFGAITSLLVLYATKRMHMSMSDAYNLSAALFSLLFILPLAGGYVCEKLGYRIGGTLGLLTTLIGTCMLAVPESHTLYIGIACFAAGNAFFTPTSYAMVGMLYPKQSGLRNSGYTLFYLLINLGFFFSTMLSGFISEINFNDSFIIGGIFICLSAILFLSQFSKIIPADEHSFAPQSKFASITRILLTIITISALTILSLIFLHHINITNTVFFALTLITSIGLFVSALKQKNPLQRRKIFAFLILCIFSIAFWSLYILEPSLITVFISQNVNRVIAGFTIPPSSYYSLDALFVIILGVVFAWLWKYLNQKNKEPSLPAKFSLALLSMGCGYFIFVVSILFTNSHTYLANSAWIVLGYAFLSCAELLISPMGLSMVGELMPKGREGLGMGIWQVYTGFSGVIAGYLANFASVPSDGSAQATNSIFMHALLKIGLGTFLIGLIMLYFVPKIRPLIQKN